MVWGRKKEEEMTDYTIADMVGKTFANVANTNNEELIFTTADRVTFKFFHSQDCCEIVNIDDICGDLQDLVGSPILQAEEVTNADFPPPENADSFTWTFYKFATIKGSVTVRWLGESNGYYSESVDLAVYVGGKEE